MIGFFKVCSILMTVFCSLKLVNENKSYFSLVQPGESLISVSVESSEETQVSFQSNQTILVNSSDDSQHEDCGDRHPVHHHCHQGHCGLIASLATLGIDLPLMIVSSVTPSDLSLIGIDLAGPRRPPRV